MLADGQQLGDDGLAKLITKNLTLSGRAFLDALYLDLCDALGEGDSLDDDISAVMLEFKSAETQSFHKKVAIT